MLRKKDAFKKFTKYKRKYSYRSLFFIEIVIKKETPAQVFFL